MKAWQFTTDTYLKPERRDAWREAMERLRLPVGDLPAEGAFHAQVSSLTSPMGVEFAVVASTPQEISGRNPHQPAAIWMAVLLEGESTLLDGDREIPMAPGDIVYGPTGQTAGLRLESRFRLLFITAPRVALDHRLLAPSALRLGHLATVAGINHVFSGLLRATADALDDLTSDQLRPVELALTEFLVACLAQDGGPAARGGAEGARAVQMHRVRQTIEVLLAEPELTLRRVADEDGVSPRYLQKLFAGQGQSFTGYVRGRRLERCRADLASPACAQLSISEICFRWGFNGSAHFSRAFRSAYGQSPREYRRAALGEEA
ncbi:helix-turn-helix domain-containing protein [Phenylobacterium sp.]|uniref:helix-turn-helix domain-containing protein n=1 Tax=Phenylobacterium sp. TaxID=1871053 RepID=UPI00272FFF0E|nr:helix-turn-helix domain-containing protein [Phenylobacterium sp.]MDP1873342.1 helix-turn-helix domain-containing protein [Phenylobacterium sp.]MDP3488883.1 helix-turn-helix domain-containing protein [Phenylobacterium sp.]